MAHMGTKNDVTPCYSLFPVVCTDPTDGLLIWNDLSIASDYLRVASDSGHAMSVATERLLRRLITLIYAGRDRMVVIRRELPRTKCAGLA